MTAAGAGSDKAMVLQGVEDRLYAYLIYSYLLIIPNNVVKLERCYQDLSNVIPLLSK